MWRLDSLPKAAVRARFLSAPKGFEVGSNPGHATPGSCDWLRDQFRSWLPSANAAALRSHVRIVGCAIRNKTANYFVVEITMQFLRQLFARCPLNNLTGPQFWLPKSGSKLLLLRCVSRPLLRCWPGCPRSRRQLWPRYPPTWMPAFLLEARRSLHVAPVAGRVRPDRAFQACRPCVDIVGRSVRSLQETAQAAADRDSPARFPICRRRPRSRDAASGARTLPGRRARSIAPKDRSGKPVADLDARYIRARQETRNRRFPSPAGPSRQPRHGVQ